MRRRLPFKLAGNILLAALVLLIAMNLLALVRVVPAVIVNAGVGPSASGLLVQLVALVTFALLVAAKTGVLRLRWSRSLVDLGMWVLLLFLVLTLINALVLGSLLFNPLSTLIILLMIPLTYRVAIGR
ncbi:MAG: hypothetical protein OHK0022_21110 [Roseiflexaceae bacterium]